MDVVGRGEGEGEDEWGAPSDNLARRERTSFLSSEISRDMATMAGLRLSLVPGTSAFKPPLFASTMRPAMVARADSAGRRAKRNAASSERER